MNDKEKITLIEDLKRVLFSLECNDAITDTVYIRDASGDIASEVLFDSICRLGYDYDLLEGELTEFRNKA